MTRSAMNRIGATSTGLGRTTFMAANNRPLSPHLQIYRPQITSVLSILHRITGVVLSAGIVVLVYWLAAAAGGSESYAVALTILGSVAGRMFLFGWTLAFFYHFLNGIRHLVWDTGRGFEITQVERSGWTVLILALAFSVAAWAILLSGGGS
jgi:succinate dehydrogenase / fumarate reductase cytochrome b subunit